MATAPYNGAGPFPGADVSAPIDAQRAVRISVTGLIVLGPFIGLGAAIWTQWGRGLGAADLALAAFFYLLTGFGVTAGLHRCLTHRSYTARPALRAALAIAGSMSFRGQVISWVAIHHSDPACARHGVDRRQVDPSAALIQLFERLGWAWDVRWPVAARFDERRRLAASTRTPFGAGTGAS